MSVVAKLEIVEDKGETCVEELATVVVDEGLSVERLAVREERVLSFGGKYVRPTMWLKLSLPKSEVGRFNVVTGEGRSFGDKADGTSATGLLDVSDAMWLDKDSGELAVAVAGVVTLDRLPLESSGWNDWSLSGIDKLELEDSMFSVLG